MWILETRLAQDDDSGYTRIMSRVDQQTCVLLRAEMYEAGATPRKVLTSDPQSIRREESTWVAHDLLLRDLLDETQTRMVVDEIIFQVSHAGIPFTPAELEDYKRTRE